MKTHPKIKIFNSDHSKNMLYEDRARPRRKSTVKTEAKVKTKAGT